MKYLKTFNEHYDDWDPNFAQQEEIDYDNTINKLNEVLNLIGINVTKRNVGGSASDIIWSVSGKIYFDISYTIQIEDKNIMSLLILGYMHEYHKNYINTASPMVKIANEDNIMHSQNLYILPLGAKGMLGQHKDYCYPQNNQELYTDVMNKIILAIDNITYYHPMPSEGNKPILFNIGNDKLKQLQISYIKNPKIIPEEFINEINRIISEMPNQYYFLDALKNKQPKIWKLLDNDDNKIASDMGNIGF